MRAATTLSVVTATSLLTSILNWLRAGYPDSVPGADRVPLLALLRATPLSDDQIKEVVRNITADGSTALADGSIDKDEIGAFIKDAISNLDYPVLMGFIMIIAVIFAMVNLLVDVSYSLIDPRVRVR